MQCLSHELDVGLAFGPQGFMKKGFMEEGHLGEVVRGVEQGLGDPVLQGVGSKGFQGCRLPGTTQSTFFSQELAAAERAKP